MSGIFPETVIGGKTVRTKEGENKFPDSVNYVYRPSGNYTTTCDVTGYESDDCDANLSPEQLNAFSAEMLALSEAFTPNGVWTCTSVTNLASSFESWQAAKDQSISDKFTSVESEISALETDVSNLSERVDNNTLPEGEPYQVLGKNAEGGNDFEFIKYENFNATNPNGYNGDRNVVAFDLTGVDVRPTTIAVSAESKIGVPLRVGMVDAEADVTYKAIAAQVPPENAIGSLQYDEILVNTKWVRDYVPIHPIVTNYALGAGMPKNIGDNSLGFGWGVLGGKAANSTIVGHGNQVALATEGALKHLTILGYGNKIATQPGLSNVVMLGANNFVSRYGASDSITIGCGIYHAGADKSIAIGNSSYVGERASSVTMLGNSTYVAESGSVALGAGSKSFRGREVSIGSDSGEGQTRYLANVTDPEIDTDGVNYRTLKNQIALVKKHRVLVVDDATAQPILPSQNNLESDTFISTATGTSIKQYVLPMHDEGAAIVWANHRAGDDEIFLSGAPGDYNFKLLGAAPTDSIRITKGAALSFALGSDKVYYQISQ